MSDQELSNKNLSKRQATSNKNYNEIENSEEEKLAIFDDSGSEYDYDKSLKRKKKRKLDITDTEDSESDYDDEPIAKKKSKPNKNSESKPKKNSELKPNSDKKTDKTSKPKLVANPFHKKPQKLDDSILANEGLLFFFNQFKFCFKFIWAEMW